MQNKLVEEIDLKSRAKSKFKKQIHGSCWSIKRVFYTNFYILSPSDVLLLSLAKRKISFVFIN